MRRDTLERIQKLKEYQRSISDEYGRNDKQYLNSKPIHRAYTEIELLEAGVDYEEHRHGFSIGDGKFIVAAQKNKWCSVKKYKWYYYSTIKQLCDKLEIKYE